MPQRNSIAEATSTADREIVITRLLDAPRELVFSAWTDPKHVEHWWGPRGFTITSHEMNVRPGGTWHFIMHGPDGVDYKNRIIFKEIVRPERLVYDHGSGEEGFADFHVTVTFDEHGGKTTLTMRSVFDTAEQRDTVVREYRAIEGGEQHLECLAEYVARMS